MQQRSHVLVLLSGGIDSACCVGWFRRESCRITALYVDFGQPAADAERDAAQRVAGHYGIPLVILRSVSAKNRSTGEIRGRNAFLLSCALMEAPADVCMIAIGIHTSSDYPDCTRQFVDDMQRVFDRCTQGTMQVSAPFVDWRREQIVQLARQLDVPIECTWSCENGGSLPCRRCASCRDREFANAIV